MAHSENPVIVGAPSAWVGRAVEEADLARRLSSPGVNVLVVGLGGVGKSALVARVVATLEARAIFVDGANGVDWLRALERALDVPKGERSRAARVRAVARALDTLVDHVVVVDGADAQTDEWAELAARRDVRAVGARFLATARAPVESPRVGTVSLGPLTVDEGAQLYRIHGGADHEDADVADVVRAAGQIPLAIVIAARWSDVLGPRALADRLAGRGARPGPRALREVALDDVLEGTWASLSADAQRVIRVVSRFKGAPSIDAVETITEGLLSTDVVDVAGDLIARGLLVRAEAGGGAALALPVPVRRFVESRAVDARELDELDRRRRAWLLDVTAPLARDSYGPRAERVLTALERIAPEVERELASGDVKVAARDRAVLALRVVDAVFFRDALPLDTALFSRAVEASSASGDDELEAMAKVALARSVVEHGDSAQAEQLARGALEAAQRASSKRAEGDARRALAWALLSRGQAVEAREQLDVARGDLASLADVRGLADVHCALGLTMLLSGDVDAAQRHVAAALSIHTTSGDAPRLKSVEAIARTVGLSPAADESDADVAERRAMLEASVSAQREGGHAMREALDAFRLALLERDSGQESTFAAWRLQARRAALAAGMPLTLADQVERLLDAGEAPRPVPSIVVGPEARWVRIGVTEHALGRHGSMRRVLDALVEARLTRPGAALSTDAVLAAGWPGERVLYAAGQYRVYTAIRRLRALGFEDALVTRDDGYLLAPSVAIARER